MEDVTGTGTEGDGMGHEGRDLITVQPKYSRQTARRAAYCTTAHTATWTWAGQQNKSMATSGKRVRLA